MYEARERLTPEQAKERIKHYCAYAERCHSQVREKLFSFGLNSRDIDPIMATLIEEGYLDEERFARQFAGGHFRTKGWGRVKIAHALKAKGVSEYCIKRGLEEIEEEDHHALLTKLASQKWKSLKGQPPAHRWAKTRLFLLQRGFDPSLVLQVLRLLQKNGEAEI
ncbi:MAG TPA: regulatory protein RecX [Phnomibacter sp.]|nr:regulatory protein RecX [Phnomibacter sp.]